MREIQQGDPQERTGKQLDVWRELLRICVPADRKHHQGHRNRENFAGRVQRGVARNALYAGQFGCGDHHQQDEREEQNHP